MRRIASLHVIVAIVALGLARPAAARLKSSSNHGAATRKVSQENSGRKLRKLPQQPESICEFEMVTHNFLTTEREIRWWKQCAVNATIALWELESPDGGIEEDDLMEPILLDQMELGSNHSNHARRLGRRRATCRCCSLDCSNFMYCTNYIYEYPSWCRRGLHEDDGEDERRLWADPNALGYYMTECLRRGYDSMGLHAFETVESYEIIGCGQGDEVLNGEDIVTIGNGTDATAVSNECITTMTNMPFIMTGEPALKLYDDCQVEMFNCYYDTVNTRMVKSEVVEQYSTEVQHGSGRRRIQQGNPINTVTNVKQVCSENGASIDLPACDNSGSRRRLTQCPSYDVVPPLQDWICDCLKERGQEHGLQQIFPQGMSCSVECFGDVLTGPEFNEKISLLEIQFKEQQEADKIDFIHEQEHDKNEFTAVVEHMQNEYTYKQMTVCGPLTERICNRKDWKTMLRVLDVGGHAEKFKGSFVPTQCRTHGDPAQPVAGRKDDKMGYQVRFMKDANGPELFNPEVKSKVEKCENDFGFGDVKCNSEGQSEVEFFVWVKTDTPDNNIDEDPSGMPENDIKDNYEAVMQKLRDYENDSSIQLDYCYFKHTIDCKCNALQG